MNNEKMIEEYFADVIEEAYKNDDFYAYTATDSISGQEKKTISITADDFYSTVWFWYDETIERYIVEIAFREPLYDTLEKMNKPQSRKKDEKVIFSIPDAYEVASTDSERMKDIYQKYCS